MANFTITATTLTFPDGTTMTTAAQSIPSGTVTNFFQAAAPTEWTKQTTNTDAAIRIVSGTGGTTGGTVGFTTAFAAQTASGTTNAYTLSTSEIPSHTHTVIGQPAAGPYGSNPQNTAWLGTQNTGATGGGGGHSHSFTSSAINLAVKYLDNIMCSKN